MSNNQNTTKEYPVKNTPFPGPKPGVMAKAFEQAFNCGPEAKSSAQYRPGKKRSLSETRLIEQDLADSIDVVLSGGRNA